MNMTPQQQQALADWITSEIDRTLTVLESCLPDRLAAWQERIRTLRQVQEQMEKRPQ